MSLKNLSISAKIGLIILVLAGACGAIAVSSVTGMQDLTQAARDIDTTSGEIRLGGRLNRLTLQLNRDEYRLATAPQEVAAISAEMDKTQSQLRAALQEVEKTADPRQRVLLQTIAQSLDAYSREIDATVAAARRHKDGVILSDAQKAILSEVQTSTAAAQALVAASLAYVAYTDEEGTRIAEAAGALASSRMTLLAVVAVGGILAGLGLGWAVSRFGIVRPINAIVGCLRALADGNLSAEVFGRDRRDEIGAIAATAAVFKDNLIRTRAMEEEARAADERTRAEKRRAMLDLAQRFEGQVGGVVNRVGQSATGLQATAAQLAAAVEEVGAQCTAVAAASEEASSNVQTVAAASEELSAAINELSQRVSRSAQRSKAAAEGAETAQRQLDLLAGAIDQVDQIVAAINTVASQTNLLALNATIEAARAGEAGKGFAVVASEVKNLANQTHAMTDQIGSQMAAVKDASSRTVTAMHAILAQVADIDRSSAEMAASVEQQSAATAEISRNAQQAATGTAEVSRNVVGIQQAETDTGHASVNVKTAADALAEQAHAMKTAVAAFLADIRAA